MFAIEGRRHGSSPSRSRSQHGSVAVEAALVIGFIVMPLVLGIIEMSFLIRDYVVVTSTSRVGARLASTAAGAGPAACPTGADAPPCTPATAPALAQLAADAIQRGGSAMPMEYIDYILVYKANADGYPGGAGNRTVPSSCAGVSNCVRYVWNSAGGGFRYAGGSWTSTSISACFPGTPSRPLERVGVYVHATRPALTGLFGVRFPLGDRAVMDFEPLPTQQCGAGDHQ